MGKAWFMVAMEYSPNRKDMVFWKIVFGKGNRHGNRYKRYSIKDTMSIKISFIHCVKSNKSNVPVVFEEFEMVNIFLLFFSKVNFNKIWGATAPQPPSPLPPRLIRVCKNGKSRICARQPLESLNEVVLYTKIWRANIVFWTLVPFDKILGFMLYIFVFVWKFILSDTKLKRKSFLKSCFLFLSLFHKTLYNMTYLCGNKRKNTKSCWMYGHKIRDLEKRNLDISVKNP